jgi:outer membrane protein assembly factor BamB
MDQPVTVILGGTTLYVGSRNKITAINAADGTVMKILTVDGSPYSLAIANGKLFASTNTGKIYCFK